MKKKKQKKEKQQILWFWRLITAPYFNTGDCCHIRFFFVVCFVVCVFRFFSLFLKQNFHFLSFSIYLIVGKCFFFVLWLYVLRFFLALRCCSTTAWFFFFLFVSRLFLFFCLLRFLKWKHHQVLYFHLSFFFYQHTKVWI